jgi:hypothetical protein
MVHDLKSPPFASRVLAPWHETIILTRVSVEMAGCNNADKEYHAPVADQRAAADLLQEKCRALSWRIARKLCDTTQKSQIHLEAASDNLHTNRREWVQYSRSSAKSGVAFDQSSASCQKQTMTSTMLRNVSRSRVCQTCRLRNLSGRRTHCSLSWSTLGHKSCPSRLMLSSSDLASLGRALRIPFSRSVRL